MPPTPDALDLDTLVEGNEGRLVLRHPVTNAPTAATLQLAGPEHPSRKSMVFARMRRRRAELARTGAITPSDPTDDELEELDLLVACTLGWNGLSAGGVALPFSAGAARELYSDPRRRWVRDQARAGLDQRELFISGSATP